MATRGLRSARIATESKRPAARRIASLFAVFPSNAGMSSSMALAIAAFVAPGTFSYGRSRQPTRFRSPPARYALYALIAARARDLEVEDIPGSRSPCAPCRRLRLP